MIGAAGRMGRSIINLSREEPFMEHVSILWALEDAKNKFIGTSAFSGAISLDTKDIEKMKGVLISSEVEKTFQEMQARGDSVIIDFSSPSSTIEILKLAEKYKIPYIIGSTGLSQSQLNEITDFAKKIPILQTTNMSLGITLMLHLAELTAQTLGTKGFDIEISEIHHHFKKDAPSGTALSLSEAIRKTNFYSKAKEKHGRQGLIGERPKANDEIGMHSLRGGDVIGDHTVFYFGEGERLELTHRASSRNAFASGALRAAMFLRDKVNQPKLYSMKDVLHLQ